MVCFSLIAKDRVMPGTDAKSSTAASLMPFSVPNRRINIRLRLGPIPDTLSIGDLRLFLLRRFLW